MNTITSENFNIKLNLYELRLIADNIQMAIDDLTSLSLNFMLNNVNNKEQYIRQCNLLNNLVNEDIELFNKLRLTKIPDNFNTDEYFEVLKTKNILVESICHLILTFKRNYEYSLEIFTQN